MLHNAMLKDFTEKVVTPAASGSRALICEAKSASGPRRSLPLRLTKLSWGFCPTASALIVLYRALS